MNLQSAAAFSNAAFLLVAPAVTMTHFDALSRDSMNWTGIPGVMRTTTPESYAEAYEDLQMAVNQERSELTDVWPVSSEARRMSQALLEILQASIAAPDVTAGDNGVIQLLWSHERGFVSVEIGATSYGLMAVNEGRPDVMRNGPTWELLATAASQISSYVRGPSVLARESHAVSTALNGSSELAKSMNTSLTRSDFAAIA